MLKMTDNEIMECLQSAAMGYGVKLTYTHKLFFMRLLTFACKDGEPCEEGLMVTLSINELSICLNICKRMVIQSLKVLNDCGILLRYKGKKSFPRCSNTTILKKEFYERDNQND